MKVAIASDHAAFRMKEDVKSWLAAKGHETVDFGTDSELSMDYPDTIVKAARAVSKGEVERAVVLCGSGVGAAIVANKVRGVRAVMCMDEYTAEYSRRHNDANVLVLAGRRRTMEDVSRYLEIWFSIAYEGGRHQRRLDKIAAIEREEGR
jgi:RpiB/LacA/LacB family sugar-phosphate isomerase